MRRRLFTSAGAVTRSFTLVAAGLLVTGCLVGPAYQRPQLSVPEQHRPLTTRPDPASLADLPWWEVFQDAALQDLVREALRSNTDLAVAAARVMEARAQAGVARSYLWPEVNATAGVAGERRSITTDPPLTRGTDRTLENWNVGIGVSWEIDLFGRLRSLNHAAIARMLATEQGQRGVVITLVGDVASGYFLLCELDLKLGIARRTLVLNDETVRFYTTRLDGGVSNRLEVDQAVANRALTAAAIPELERQIAVTENALSVLLGRLPGPIARGAALEEQYHPPQIPAGLPATLLERRPDVVASEQLLVAANADIGAARALFFPTISLAGIFGGASHGLDGILNADATSASLTAGLFQPIFQAGRIRRNAEAAQARFEQALAAYRGSALNAYREVADALVTIDKLAAVRVSQMESVAALQDASKLSRSRYDTGLSNYLEVLIADQQLFSSELQLARTRGDELRAVAQLYRALGGGWQPEQEQGATPAQSEDQNR
jgi:outer membrane protein, multidrug efflux system